ncbi:MAG TPA: hypothetical protein VM899_03715 [Rubellimicrobium sp.]|nr:hypothetical protein [Rubellimicrobium sp.]
MRTPRHAVGTTFLLAGGLFGAWASRIPAFVEAFQLSERQLGLLLLCIAPGAIALFPLAGRLADRMGASRLGQRVATFYVLAFWALGRTPGPSGSASSSSGPRSGRWT